MEALKPSGGILGASRTVPFIGGKHMNISERAQNLCDSLYKTLTGKHGFRMVGDSYGWSAPGGYMVIDWQVDLLDHRDSGEPDDLEGLGVKVQEIASQYGWQLIKLEAEKGGYGDFYFKPIPNWNPVDDPF